jgi:hypothetical protein
MFGREGPLVARREAVQRNQDLDLGGWDWPGTGILGATRRMPTFGSSAMNLNKNCLY